MSRLPKPGEDNGNWGEILNDFLEQSHNGDGSLKEEAIPKSTNVTTDGSSDAKIPSVKAIKDYTDGKVEEVNTQLDAIAPRVETIEGLVDDLANGGVDTTARSGLAAIEGALVSGVSGKKLKIISGVIRNTGSGWALISDDTHVPINIDTVSQSSTRITINYPGISAKKVVTFLAVPDDEFAGVYEVGTSVGISYTEIIVKKREPRIGAYVYYSGTEWTMLNTFGNVTLNDSAFSASGKLTFSHDAIGSDSNAWASGRSATCIPQPGSNGATSTEIYLYDFAGNAITTPTNQKFFWGRDTGRPVVVDPTTLISAGGNFWLFGIMVV